MHVTLEVGEAGLAGVHVPVPPPEPQLPVPPVMLPPIATGEPSSVVRSVPASTSGGAFTSTVTHSSGVEPVPPPSVPAERAQIVCGPGARAAVVNDQETLAGPFWGSDGVTDAGCGAPPSTVTVTAVSFEAIAPGITAAASAGLEIFVQVPPLALAMSWRSPYAELVLQLAAEPIAKVKNFGAIGSLINGALVKAWSAVVPKLPPGPPKVASPSESMTTILLVYP